MATTTTNYGFDVPTSSDLVKNGATQIALLGQDLDTFLFRPFTRNALLNSGFNVWQRGTSISNFGAFSLYTADRWNFVSTNTGRTISRQLTGDTTNLPNIQYCGRFQRNSGDTNTTYFLTSQSIETVNSIPYAGKQVTFSFYARKGANYSATSSLLGFLVASGTGTDQQVGGFTGQVDFINSTATLTTTWQRFTATATVASNATQLGVIFRADPTGTAGAADYFEITGVQLEVGNQASPYAPATPTYATELAACQRYYYRASFATNEAIGTANFAGATNAQVVMTLPTVMRSDPAFNAGAGNIFAIYTNILYASSAITLDTVSFRTVSLNAAITGGVVGQAGIVYLNLNSNNFLQFDSEL